MSEEILPTLLIDDMDHETDVNCAPGRVGGDVYSNLNNLLFLPKAGDPILIGKILPDFRSKDKRANFPIEYHEFSIGAAITDKRFFFSPKCFGEKDALTDLFWEAIIERKKFSDNKESKDYRYWDQIVKMSRPKKGCLLYWIGKGESKVQILMLKEPAMDVLFGAPAKKDAAGKDVPPIPGLVKEMRELGESPFNLKVSTGWVKLFKTGTGSSTQFHAELDQIRTEEIYKGKRTFILSSAEAAVDPAILRADAKTIPDFKEVCKQKAWSKEEIEAYISSDFTSIPERYTKKKTFTPPQQREEIGGNEVANAVETAYNMTSNDSCSDVAEEDDIPF